jgi:hypothetical protein
MKKWWDAQTLRELGNQIGGTANRLAFEETHPGIQAITAARTPA